MVNKLLRFIRSKLFEKIATGIAFVNMIIAYMLIYHMYSITDYTILIRYCIKCIALEFCVGVVTIIYNILTREK